MCLTRYSIFHSLHISLFRSWTAPSLWKMAAMAIVAVPELEGKDSRMFADLFHWHLSFTQMFFEIKQTLEGGKKKHPPESISFHIPSSCDVEELKMNAKKVKGFHSEGWDGIFFFKKNNNNNNTTTTTKTHRKISAPGCQRHNAFALYYMGRCLLLKYPG